MKPSCRLKVYLGLTFLISWGIWVPLAWIGASNQALLWIAGFGPTLSALILTGREAGSAGLMALLKESVFAKVRPIWLLMSLLGAPTVMLIALVLHVSLSGNWPQLLDPNHLVTEPKQWPLVIIVILYIFLFTSLGEEFGWRGFALSCLQTRFTPFISSLILGSIWAIWHFPLFFMTNSFHAQLPLHWFGLQVLGSTFIYTWMFNHTQRNLLPALLFHTSSNAAMGLAPILPLDNGGSLRPLWLAVTLLWMCVGLILWLDRAAFFPQRPGHLGRSGISNLYQCISCK